MKIDDPSEILTMIVQLQLATQPLQQNRTLINRLFNGEVPFTPEECREDNIRTNVNFLEGTRIASNATNQLNSAFFKGDRFFSVRVDKGPSRLRPTISSIITKYINRELKRDRAYRSARESANAQVVLHGAGPLPWRNRMTPTPSTGGIEDVIIPAGTLCDMSNLDRFALYRELTWGQLHNAAFGPVVDKGWNRDYVKALLATMFDMGFQPIYQGNRWLFPEKLAEDYKEGASWTISSSLPRVLAWDFFYLDEDTGKWNRRMIVDYANIDSLDEKNEVVKNKELLYQRDDYAEDWQHIIHWYIGNCSNVAPYRYHSIRSIGYLLFGICMIQNKLRNRLFDHMFQQLLTLFRNVSDDNREKLGLIDLQNFGVMPDGVSMVPANERYLVDPNFIMLGMNQATQLMAQSASSFIPDMPGGAGDRKTMTATETLVRQNTSITLTSAVLNQLGDQSLYEYREIARRFCIKNNPDPMAKRFREAIQKEGVPLEALDIEAWEIMPEMAVGGGNKAQELTVTQALMQEVFPLVDPDAQRLILRRRYASLTDNPDEAMSVVPEIPKPGGNDLQQAQLAFSVLILGLPFQDVEGVNHVVTATTLMQMSQVTLQQAEAAAQSPQGLSLAAEKVAGVANVLSHVQAEIQKIAQNEGALPMVKQMQKMHDQLSGVAQNIGKQIMAAEQEMQPQDGLDAKTRAKIMEMQATAETQRQIASANAQQKLEQRQIQWLSETQRKNASAQADAERKLALTAVDIHATDLKTKAELMREAAEPAETE